MDIRAGTIGKSAVQEPSDLLKTKIRKAKSADGLGDVAIAREEARRSDSRDQDRVPLNGECFRLTHCGRDHEVQVINLSGGGAMIATHLHPNLAERLHLHLAEDATVECVVRWIKDGRLGLEFAHETQLECPAEERAEVLRQVLDRSFPSVKTGVEDDPEQRVAKRHPLIWSGQLRAATGSWNVRLRNVSATGALVQCGKSLPVGRLVTLDLGKAGTLDATVSWAVGDHAGLHFSEPFDMSRLSHSKPHVAPAQWLRPAYLENDVPAESAWDDAWSRLSVDELKAELEGFLKR